MTDRADLVIGNARLRGRGEPLCVAIAGGRISALSVGTLSGDVELDAWGGLVTESFVDAHLHLDKVRTLDRVGEEALAAHTGSGMGAAMTAIELAAAVKQNYSQEDTCRNGRRALLDGIRHGALHVQAFAVD